MIRLLLQQSVFYTVRIKEINKIVCGYFVPWLVIFRFFFQVHSSHKKSLAKTVLYINHISVSLLPTFFLQMFCEHFKFPIDFTRMSEKDSERQDSKTQDSSQQQGEIGLWSDHAQTPLVQFIFNWSPNWFGSDPICVVFVLWLCQCCLCNRKIVSRVWDTTHLSVQCW